MNWQLPQAHFVIAFSILTVLSRSRLWSCGCICQSFDLEQLRRRQQNGITFNDAADRLGAEAYCLDVIEVNFLLGATVIRCLNNITASGQQAGVSAGVFLEFSFSTPSAKPDGQDARKARLASV
jgi:hypothetical protein